jgi:hypothetical protein
MSMFPRHMQPMRRVVGRLALLVFACAILACAPFAQASSATLLLEEPYGTLGFFSATGHVAVYLSGVCAETPLVLRPCKAGENGVVISRYNGVNGYDWIAIPLIPYLYAVDRPEEVPLFADQRMVAVLRDRYRRKYLEDIVPDKNGDAPGGNWYELVGTSYDRTVYGFEIATTPERDRALIRWLNSSPNQSHFHTVSRNCADFAKDIINFYYPRALHRSIIADVGISTPKQMAKRLVKFTSRHPELESSRMVIAQVPGSVPRSTAVHGVVEAFFKSKKYMVPSAVINPIFAGSVFAVYVGSGAGRFKPAQGAQVFIAGEEPENPIDREDLHAYQSELKHMLAGAYPETSRARIDKQWEKLQAKATTEFDAQGRPVIDLQFGEEHIRIGASADNIFDGNPPPQLVRELLEARLQSELRHSSPSGISEEEVVRDWKLLHQSMTQTDARLTARSTQRTDAVRMNRP